MSADGTWNVTVNSPMGPQSGTMTVTVEGDRFTGALDTPMGPMPVIDGTVAGDTLRWSMAMTSPMPITLEASARVSGDALTGEVKAGAFGSMPLSGTRA